MSNIDVSSGGVLLGYASMVGPLVPLITVKTVKSGLLGYVSMIVSVSGAVASWIPFYAKKPSLSLSISIKVAFISRDLGGIPSTSNALRLVIKIKNNGDKAANNVGLKMIAKFWNSQSGKLLSQPEDYQKISGDLLPGEEIEIWTPVNDRDTAYPHNHINITLSYQDSILWLRRKYKRDSVWFFNVQNNVRVSDDMNKVDKINSIPSDLFE